MQDKKIREWEEEGEANAAQIICVHVSRNLADRSNKSEFITNQVKTLLAVRWSKKLLTIVGRPFINQLIRRIRGTETPREVIDEITRRITEASEEGDPDLPEGCDEWKFHILRNGLAIQKPLSDWAPLFRTLMKVCPMSMEELGNLSKGELLILSHTYPDLHPLPTLWRSIRSSPEFWNSQKGRLTNHPPEFMNPASSIRANSLSETRIFIDYEDSKRQLGLPTDFENLGPQARTKSLQKTGQNGSLIERFARLGSQVNILRQVEKSLPAVASGIQGYCDFCTLREQPPFPPSAETIREWSAAFKAGRTFSMYLRHVEKACQILNFKSDWLTPEVRALAKGLQNSHREDTRFDNFISKDQMSKIIRHFSMRDSHVQLWYLSFIFLLRTTNEGLPLRRALSDTDLLNKEVPMTDDNLIGIRIVSGTKKLVIRLKTRKNSRSGAILIRNCVCTEGRKELLCPLHSFWEFIQANIQRGERLFPGISKSSVNKVLKKKLSLMNFESAKRFSSHAFRRGAAMEIQGSGSSMGQILRAGGWSSSAFKVYLSLDKAEGEEIDRILTRQEVSDSSSEEAVE